MLNFWISLYATIVVTLAGSMWADSVQISRIGSQDEIRTQALPANLPTEPLLPSQAAPDEQ